MDLNKERECYTNRQIKNFTIDDEPESPIKSEDKKRRKETPIELLRDVWKPNLERKTKCKNKGVKRKLISMENKLQNENPIDGIPLLDDANTSGSVTKLLNSTIQLQQNLLNIATQYPSEYPKNDYLSYGEKLIDDCCWPLLQPQGLVCCDVMNSMLTHIEIQAR